MKIYSIHYNKPEYINIQYDTLSKFMKVDYEFIIVDNSVDTNIKSKIKKISNELHLRCIDCNNSINGMSSHSHQNSFKYLLDDVNDGDVVMILDHDVFMSNELTYDYYKDYDIVMLPQQRGHVIYPWPGMIIFNKIKNKNEISFQSGNILGQACDTGGNLYYYLNNNLKIKSVNETILNEGELLSSNIDNIFLHLVSGSDWNKSYNLEKKLDFLLKKINYDK